MRHRRRSMDALLVLFAAATTLAFPAAAKDKAQPSKRQNSQFPNSPSLGGFGNSPYSGGGLGGFAGHYSLTVEGLQTGQIQFSFTDR